MHDGSVGRSRSEMRWLGKEQGCVGGEGLKTKNRKYATNRFFAMSRHRDMEFFVMGYVYVFGILGQR